MTTQRFAQRIGDGPRGPCRTLALLLGDQLDCDPPALEGLDRQRDVVMLAEVEGEARHVPSHRQRTALFLAAMRHRALQLREAGYRVRYVRLDDPKNSQDLAVEVARALRELSPTGMRVAEPGDHRVRGALQGAAAALDCPLDIVPDRRFLVALDAFARWAKGRKEVRMEHFYRAQRRARGVLMDAAGKPVGGQFNFDADNREPLRDAPEIRPPQRFAPDAITQEVIALVAARFADGYGSLDGFDWPVTHADAEAALCDFVEHRLPGFGPHQDAMWRDAPYLGHALLSPALNLGLLSPQRCLDAVLGAYEARDLPLQSVEGFVRQVLGWREFVRGVYHYHGAEYLQRNALGAEGALPAFYWTGDTDLQCLRQSVGQVVAHGYAHHIQRLMVLGNFAMLLGVRPRAVSDWFLGMFVDGVDWVTAPNTIGMSQYADGGFFGSKPYAASGNYIRRMSNYCDACPYDVRERTGERACPFNALYWDFLRTHRDRFADNPRMRMMLSHLDRMGDGAQQAVHAHAQTWRRRLAVLP